MNWKKNKKSRKSLVYKCISVVLSMSLLVAMPFEQKETSYAQKANSGILSIQTTEAKTGTIKNIIYMVPDGGGFPSYDIATKVKEAGGLTYLYKNSNFNGTKPTENKMYMADYLIGSVTTKSANNATTDSAAAGTALATGKKTNNDYTGVTSAKKPIANLTELAQLEGKATGLIATSYSYDATPAAFSAHAKSRSDSDTIISQMLHTDLTVMLGGGMSYTGYTKKDNLKAAKELGYTVVNTEDQLNAAAASATEDTKIWGGFQATNHHMPYDIGYGSSYDGIDDSKRQAPTLAEMTKASIEVLSKNSNGFFLMVEGSKVDYGNHHRMMTESAGEYIAFDEAFKVAVDYAKEHKDTVVVVVPDHNTGLNTTPNAENMQKVVKMIQNGESTKNATSLLDFSSYAGEGDSAHTGMNVGIWMYVPDGVDRLKGTATTAITDSSKREAYTIDNTQVAPYLASLWGDKTLNDATNELYIDASDYGTYTNGEFQFTGKNASVTINTDKATIEGKDIELAGKLSIYEDGHCYVPKEILQRLNISVGQENEKKLQGTGTQEDPYVIANEANFLEFTNTMKNGESYAGKYIKQTANIDMEGISDYAGIAGNDANMIFKGSYDGQGHSINVNIKAENEQGISIFPYTSGVIKNLGTTGSITNTAADNGCAGIARSIRKGGTIVNCWSTVDLNATKDAAGIAWTIKDGATMYNCFYKGKIITKNNYGVGIVNGTVENCFYQMEQGSTAVSISTTNKAGGKETDTFSAQALNGYQKDAVDKLDILKDTEQLCKFVEYPGYTFAFAGSVAGLKEITYTYTCKDGEKKTNSVKNFSSDVTGYSEIIGDEMNPHLPIEISGKPVLSDGEEIVTGGTTKLDTKGCGNGEITVTATVKNAYYETKSVTRYSILFSGPGATEETAKPDLTATPIVQTSEPATSIPTQTPENTKVPVIEITVAPITVPTEPASEQNTPLPTQDVEKDTKPVPSADIDQGQTVAPKDTDIPSVTTMPSITATPEIKKQEINKSTILNVKKSYVYTGNSIKPVPVVTINRYVLLPKVDYTLSYSGNINAGIAKITIKGKGEYIGSKVVTFRITPKSVKQLKFTKIKKQRYTGKAIKPNVSAKYGKRKLKRKIDFTIVYRKNRKKGTAVVYVKGKGNYTGTKRLTFQIK